MIQHYGFDGQPVTEDEWYQLWETKHAARKGNPESMPEEDPSRIGSDHVSGLWVSTVWLGLDHSFGDGPPLIFETMVFEEGSLSDRFCARYSTPAEAKEGHDRVVSWLREGHDLDEFPFLMPDRPDVGPNLYTCPRCGWQCDIGDDDLSCTEEVVNWRIAHECPPWAGMVRWGERLRAAGVEFSYA